MPRAIYNPCVTEGLTWKPVKMLADKETEQLKELAWSKFQFLA